MFKYKTMHVLEWREEENCIRVMDSNDQEVHVFWNEDLESLRSNVNFGPETNIVAHMLNEFDHWEGEVDDMKYFTYDRTLDHVLKILELREPFLEAMTRKCQSILTESISLLFNENRLEYCIPEFVEMTSDFIEEQSCKSILVRYLEIAIANHSPDSRLEIDFYIDELDSIEEALFASETDTLEE